MSAQMNDIFQYRNKDYSISAIENEEQFFNIEDFGLRPRPNCSACWRGYIAVFGIDRDNRLALIELTTNNGDDPPPDINGVSPVIMDEDFGNEDRFNFDSISMLSGGDLQYSFINLPIKYTGKLLITDGFIQERYEHMGFHSPLSYKKVIELLFNGGVCVGENDMSALAERKRREQDANGSRWSYGIRWIEETFNMSYASKWS